MKVFIADDSAILLERLQAMISEMPEIEIVGESGKAQESIKAKRLPGMGSKFIELGSTGRQKLKEEIIKTGPNL
jgi:DNA-binding NarL/FixJ family response regulator